MLLLIVFDSAAIRRRRNDARRRRDICLRADRDLLPSRFGMGLAGAS